jgi:predicted nucleic acid-binding protein
VILYAESSAVLSWLLEERAGEPARRALEAAGAVAASRLTLFECTRALRRAEEGGLLDAARTDRARTLLAGAAARWELVEVAAEILAEADRRFPREPVRSLDALHLGTALFLRPRVPGLAFLTLDDRIAGNARLLGFPVLPGKRRTR